MKYKEWQNKMIVKTFAWDATFMSKWLKTFHFHYEAALSSTASHKYIYSQNLFPHLWTSGNLPHSSLPSVSSWVLNVLWEGAGPVRTWGFFPLTWKQPNVRLLRRWASPGLHRTPRPPPHFCSKAVDTQTLCSVSSWRKCLSQFQVGPKCRQIHRGSQVETKKLKTMTISS